MYISFKESNVTPAKRSYLGGYERSEKSTGCLDKIMMNTCVMKFDEEFLVFIVIDCICISEVFTESVQIRLNEIFHISKMNINVACLHTHSAPLFFPLPTLPSDYEEESQKLLFKTIIEDVTYCLKNMREAKMRLYRNNIEGCYGNRNSVDGEADKNFTLLEFVLNHQVIGYMAHMACHPTILGRDNLMMSSDLLGRIRSKLKTKFQVPVMMINGACGDVSTRFYREEQGIHEVDFVADKVIAQLTFDNGTEIRNEQLQVRETNYLSSFDVSKDAWTKNELLRMKKELANKENARKYKNLYHRLTMKMEKGIINLTVNSRIYKIDDLILVTISGEVVSYYAHYLRKRFPNNQIFVFSYCNGYVSYLINEDNYGKYFESYVAITPKGTLENLSKRIEESIEAMIA